MTVEPSACCASVVPHCALVTVRSLPVTLVTCKTSLLTRINAPDTTAVPSVTDKVVSPAANGAPSFIVVVVVASVYKTTY